MKQNKVIQEIRDAQPGLGQWMIHDQYNVDGALLFLEEYFVNASYDRPKANPLCMAVSLIAPHYPYQCPMDLFTYYMQRVEPIVEEPNEQFEYDDFFRVRVGEDVTYRQAHRATAAYYGMIEWMDAQFSRVIEKLEHLNVLDDFIIVFLSDHGEMLGTKGLWEKQSYFEASARVPLSIWYPKRFGREPKVIEQNVSLVDLFPTVCELVDIPAPDELDGRSFLPLIDGNTTDWHDTVYSELWRAQNGPSVMVKEGSLKYFRFDNDKGWPEQLFDLSKDPDERNNLMDVPAYADALSKLRAKAEALPPPRRKDENNRFIDPYRPITLSS
jgi:choline-sulfatase